jgi:hypothetical protein
MSQYIAQSTPSSVPLGTSPITGAGTIGQQVNSALGSGGGTGSGVVDVFSQQFSNLIGFITVLGGLFFLVYMLIAAFDWIQAGGDSGKIDKAKTKMTNGAIGLLVMILAFGIIGIIGSVFGIDLLNPGAVFLQLIK